MEKNFKKGEIVWAKIRGYPWWPGVVWNFNIKIGQIQLDQKKEIKYLVNFIGDNTHAELPLVKIEKFEKKLIEYSKTKKINLLESITIAKKIINGEMTYDVHQNCMKKNKIKKISDVNFYLI